MKRFIALFLISIFILSMLLVGCGSKEEKTKNNVSVSPVVTKEAEATSIPEDNIINVWSYNNDLPEVLKTFEKLNPDFGYEIKSINMNNWDSGIQGPLDEALATDVADAPDIYTVESAFALKYTQGEAAQYALPYKDLGIDVDGLLKEASLAKYSIDLGTNLDGNIVGLGYQSASGAFIYRRSIAKDVWGTDDPNVIKSKVGPGWDVFMTAAESLKAKGYAICSSVGDLWIPVSKTNDQPWVVDGKLEIDPKREVFMDMAMQFKKNGYLNNTQTWMDEWYKDMSGKGKKKVFGFLGPSWFLNYVIMPNSGGKKVGEGTYGDWAVCEPPVGYYWGGSWVLANKNTSHKEAVAKLIKWITLDTSETGLQYLWANDKLGLKAKDAVNSVTVMKKSDGKLDFLGGQNIFDTFITAGDMTYSKNLTMYDESTNNLWLEQVNEYINGKKSREQAIADFKQKVASDLNIESE